VAPKQPFKILDRLADPARVLPPLVDRPPFPANLMVELSNACNHSCVFCANPKSTRPIGRLDGTLLRRLLTEAHALGVREVGFYTTGDPFVHKELPAFVRFANEVGIAYKYVSTNGALATPAVAKAAIDAGLDSIKFSINGGSRASYAQIHGKDEYERVIDNLTWISNYRQTLDRPLFLSITYVVIDQNRHEIESFRERLGPLVDDIYFSPGATQGGNMLEVLDVLVPAEAGPVGEIKPCWMLFGRAHVTCEGYLTLCCVDYQNYLAVADLNRTTLEQAWVNPQFVAMRRRHLDNRLEGTLCYNCMHDRATPIQPLIPEFATSVDWSGLNEQNRRELQRRIAVKLVPGDT
jgi:molybdenum cofactor biosynthesis enzyme MoaA